MTRYRYRIDEKECIASLERPVDHWSHMVTIWRDDDRTGWKDGSEHENCEHFAQKLRRELHSTIQCGGEWSMRLVNRECR